MDQTKFAGGCLCGSVRYEISDEPITLYACHCTDCQTASGSSFVLAMRVPHGGIAATFGSPKAFVRERSDGRKKDIYRCPSCLTALWGSHGEKSDYITVYAGTLDNSPLLEPVVHIWMEDAQPWINVPEKTLKFSRNAPERELFSWAWKNRSKPRLRPTSTHSEKPCE